MKYIVTKLLLYIYYIVLLCILYLCYLISFIFKAPYRLYKLVSTNENIIPETVNELKSVYISRARFRGKDCIVNID